MRHTMVIATAILFSALGAAPTAAQESCPPVVVCQAIELCPPLPPCTATGSADVAVTSVQSPVPTPIVERPRTTG